MSIRTFLVDKCANQAAGGSAAVTYSNEGDVLVWDWVRITFCSPRNYSFTNLQIDADKLSDKRPIVLSSAIGSGFLAGGNGPTSIVIAPGQRMINFRLTTTFTNEHTSAASYGCAILEFGVDD